MGIAEWADNMGWIMITDIQSMLNQPYLMQIFGWQTKLSEKTVTS